MWRKRRGSYGGGATLRGLDSPSRGPSSSSLTGFPAGASASKDAPKDAVAAPLPALFGRSEPAPRDAPLAFTVEVPTPGPLGLDLRARHVERGRPQRGAVVKGFRPLEGGERGYLEATGRVQVGDVLEVIHKLRIDELPFDQIVAHALQLQKDASAWPLRLDFRREPTVQTNAHTAGGSDADRGSATSRPRRGSFFRNSVINPVQDSTNFNEKLNYFRGFFANRMPTGGAAPKAIEKPPRPPSHDTVDEMYRDLLLKRGVPDDVMDELMRIESVETKWHVVWYAQQHANEDNTQSNAVEAARFAENLVELAWDNKGLKELEALRNKIAVASTDWLESFLASFGLDYLTMKLPDPSPFPLEHSKYEKATKICEVILRILRSLTHFTAGVEAMTNTPGLVKRVALCFHTENGDVKKYTLQLLGIVCYNSAAGHQAVIEAFDHYKETKGESIRFSCLRDALKSARYSLVFKEDVLSFVNIIVNKAIRLEDRLAIRSDFMALKMAGYFEEIRAKSLAVQQKAHSISNPNAAAAADKPSSAAPSPALRPQSTPAVTPAPSPGVTPIPERKLSTAILGFALAGSPSVSPAPKDPGTPAAPPPKSRLLNSPDYAGISQSVPNLFRASIGSKSAPPSPIDREARGSLPLREDGRSSLPPENKIGGKNGGNSSIISSTVTQLRNQLDNMEKQIDVFERFMEDDRKDTIYERTDLAAPDSVYERLSETVSGDPELQSCFLSVLQQLLFIPGDTVIGKEMWALVERIVKQIALLAPVEEVRNFELGYEDRKTLMKMRDRYTGFLQKCAEEDPTFHFHIGPVILIQNREHGDDLLSDTADETDEEDLPDHVAAREHPDLSKFFKLLKMGMPAEHVKMKMSSELPEFDPSILDTPDVIIQLGKPGPSEKQEGTRAEEHEKYVKFFKLKKMGMPLPHIQLKMSAEGLDSAILDTPDLLLDPEGNEVKKDKGGTGFAGIRVKDHEKFAKFFKLLKMGMPLEHVKLKVSSEGLDGSLLDAPDTLLDEEGKVFVASVSAGPQGIAVRDHEKFAKYFKLIKMGMPMEHIKLKASAEGLDASLLDTPDVLLNEDGTKFVEEGGSAPKGTPVKEHEKFVKFFKLLKMGMPLDHVKLKASAEGLDADLLDTPDALVDDDGKRVTETAADELKGTPVKEHEKFAKFFKLMKMGMPLDHVKLKASAEGLDANLLETPDALVDEDGKVVTAAVKGTPVKDHEMFAKFFKLLKMGMPMEHVKLKVSSEGLDASLLETPDKLVDKDGKEVKAGGSAVKKVKASEHPSYAKYFKLLKMGMPRPQVELKLGAEGLDAKVLDSPDAMIPEDLSALQPPPAPRKPAVVAPPKPKLRNLYWEPMKEDAVAGTIWESFVSEKPAAQPTAEVKPSGPVSVKDLFAARAASGAGKPKLHDGPSSKKDDDVLVKYVEKLADIFVNKPAKAKEEPDGKKVSAKRRAPTRVALIDVKRANNIGIMLARFRLPYTKIRDAVLMIDKEILSIERVSAMIQFAPEDAELEAVRAYDGDPKLLGDAEQYFRALLCVPRLPTRLQAVHATWQFDTYVEEQQKLMDSVKNACQELRECSALKVIFGVVLSLGNALNDGTARGGATGFRLSILLKLNQVKASDNSITLLNYLAKVLRDKDPSIFDFDKSLPSIESASRVTVQVLKAGESAVRKASALICDELEAHAKLPPSAFPQPADKSAETGEAAAAEVSDRFQEVVKPFAERATKLSEGVTHDLDSMMQQFQDTVAFYGEDPASPECGPDSFFSIFYSFAKVLQAADRDNERKRIAEERRVRREEETKKRLEALKNKKKNTSLASLKAGDVDDIVMKIRAKRVEEKRRELRDQPPTSTSSSRGGAAVVASPTSQPRVSSSSSNGASKDGGGAKTELGGAGENQQRQLDCQSPQVQTG